MSPPDEGEDRKRTAGRTEEEAKHSCLLLFGDVDPVDHSRGCPGATNTGDSSIYSLPSLVFSAGHVERFNSAYRSIISSEMAQFFVKSAIEPLI